MSKLFIILPVSLFVLITIPAYAIDWCGRPDGSAAPCVNNIVPNGWFRCGTFNQGDKWCPPVESVKTNNIDNTTIDKSKNIHKSYLGISLGYVALVNGEVTSDYAGKTDSWIVPGSFQESKFELNPRSTPVQISFGTEIIDNLRVDISYMMYSGISMPGLVKTAAGGRSGSNGYFSFHGTGGDVSGNTTMMNIYYNLDRFTGRFFGGLVSPYIGAGIGLGTNEISDYEVFDDGAYFIDAGWTGSSNIHAVHSGGTTKNNFAYMFEAGGTSELFGLNRLHLDIFIRWTGLGKVKTNGDVLLTQTVWQGGAPIGDEAISYKNYTESGTLSMWDVGARLRFLF